MTKWPQPGRVKTRLCPPLRPEEAAELARCFLLDMLAEAARAGADRLLAFAPDAMRERFRCLAGPAVGLIEAEAADLGASLEQAQRSAFAAGYRRVALVAADLPHLACERYGEAFAALDGTDVVLGPSGDGGYYLLAASAPTPALFREIAWSTATVSARTRERAAAGGLRLMEIAASDDVDTVADLPPLLAALRARPGAGHSVRALERLLDSIETHARCAGERDRGYGVGKSPDAAGFTGQAPQRTRP